MGTANLPAWLLLVEVLLCFSLVFALHSLRRKTSLVFSFASLTFMTFASWAAPHHTAVSVGPFDFYVESNVFFTAALLNMFLLYVADGPRLGRMGLAIVVGTGVAYTVIALLLHAQFPEARVAGSVFPSAHPRSALASVVASLIDLLVLGVAWEFFQKGKTNVPLSIRVFMTLLLVLWVDSLVYVPLAWGTSLEFLAILHGSLLSRVALAAFSAPLVTWYLKYEIARHGLKLEGRPILSILTREDLETELVATRHSLRLGAEALWESEERYRRMVNDIPTMVFRFTLDGLVTYVNQALCTYYETDAEQLVGKHVLGPVDRSERSAVWKKILALSPERAVTELVAHAYPKPGDRRLQRWMVRGIFGKDGAGLAFQAVGEDVTLQAKAEETARMFGAALEQAGELVVVVGARGAISYVNGAFAGAMGQPARGLQGSRALGLLRMFTMRRQARELVSAIRAGRPWTGVASLAMPGLGQRTVRLSVSHVTDEAWANEGLVLVGRDISDEVAAEKRAQDLDKAQMVSRISAGVAHDFNNLIQVIWGCAETAALELADNSDEVSRCVRLALEDIRQGADRASALARQLMTLGRKTETRPELLDVSDAVRRIAPLLERCAPQTVTLSLELLASQATTLIDSSELERLLINLVTNAGGAVGPGGHIRVATSEAEIPTKDARLLLDVEPGEYVVVSVTDDGHGMDAQTLARVFEPFFTTKERGKGTGLGLATVLAIVQGAQGSIRVESAPGRGTSFEVLLPRARSGARPSGLPQSGPPLVLYCERDQELRERMSEALQLAGYQVAAYDAIHDLLRHAAEVGAQRTVFLLDIVATDESGTHATRAIQARFPSAPMVLMSSTSQEAAPLSRRDPSARGVLLRKPFDRFGLLSALHEALHPDTPADR